jgi:hypothetical protein
MRCRVVPALTLAAMAWALPVRADVELTISNGRVTLLATDATVSEILAAWARVGQTRIVNGDRVTGGPVTLHLTDVPEAEALDVVLRSVAGYLAAPRAAILAGASHFDRIVVMPTSNPPRVTAAPPPPAFTPPPAFPPAFPEQFDDPQDMPVPGQGPPRGPVFNTFPPQDPSGGPVPVFNGQPPQPVQPPQAAPAGVAVPGMIVPMPQPATQPGQVFPGQPFPTPFPIPRTPNDP